LGKVLPAEMYKPQGKQGICDPESQGAFTTGLPDLRIIPAKLLQVLYGGP
jgi:hypothetical protein